MKHCQCCANSNGGIFLWLFHTVIRWMKGILLRGDCRTFEPLPVLAHALLHVDMLIFQDHSVGVLGGRCRALLGS